MQTKYLSVIYDHDLMPRTHFFQIRRFGGHGVRFAFFIQIGKHTAYVYLGKDRHARR